MLAKSKRSVTVLENYMATGCFIRGIILESPVKKDILDLTIFIWSRYSDYDGNIVYSCKKYTTNIEKGITGNYPEVLDISLSHLDSTRQKKLLDLIRSWQIEHPHWLIEDRCVFIYQNLDGIEWVLNTNDSRVRDHLIRFHQILQMLSIQVLERRLAHFLAEIYQ